MLGPTLVLPLPAADITLPLINNDSYGAEYYFRDSLVSYRVLIRHSTVKKGSAIYDRHNVTLVKKTFATSTVPEFDHQVSFTIQCLPQDALAGLSNGLMGWLETSINIKAATNAVVSKLLGWES